MLQKSSTEKALKVFFNYPSKEHYLMDISRKIKVAHTSVKNNLDKLVKSGIIIRFIDKKGKRSFPLYKVNTESKLFKKYKLINNISSILESELVELLETKYAPKCIILFGSYSKGEDVEDSDIDLFLECKEEKVNIEKFEKILNRKINLHFKENFNSYSKELKNNLINGIILNGFLEGFK
jgi:predicted nucleotidyltransferase